MLVFLFFSSLIVPIMFHIKMGNMNTNMGIAIITTSIFFILDYNNFRFFYSVVPYENEFVLCRKIPDLLYVFLRGLPVRFGLDKDSCMLIRHVANTERGGIILTEGQSTFDYCYMVKQSKEVVVSAPIT